MTGCYCTHFHYFFCTVIHLQIDCCKGHCYKSTNWDLANFRYVNFIGGVQNKVCLYWEG